MSSQENLKKQMLSEISTLSQQIGIGYFLLYENPSTLQKAKEYLKNLNIQDIEAIIQSLEKSEQDFMKSNIPVQKMTKQSKGKQHIIIEINICLQELKDQVKARQLTKQRQEKENKDKNQQRKRFIFDGVKIIVIGTLAMLFVISLFSSNQWMDDEIVVIDRSFDEENSKNKVNHFTYDSNKMTSENQTHLFEQQNRIKIPEYDQKQQQQKTYTQQSQVYNHTTFNEENYNSSLPLQNIALAQNVTFSTFEMIEEPLTYTYNIILTFTSQQTAYFICAYILYFVFWAIAILFHVFQICAALLL